MRPAPLLFLVLLCTSCGYVGPVLPPSPRIPTPITDLTAVQRGDKLVISFTTPARTTDGVGISQFTDIDLRIGPADQTPEAAKAYSVPLPPPSDKDDPQPKPISYSIDAADWAGQTIGISVRTSARKTDHFSAWSKRASLEVIAPLAQPVVHTEATATGIRLTWDAVPGAQYTIERQASGDKQPLELATVNSGTYDDVSAQYDTEYRYFVTAKKGTAESQPYETPAFTAVDIFPPAVPTGLTALIGPDGINLAWHRNTESDLHGYYIFRSTDGGTYARVGEMVALPTYLDSSVEHGKTYSYKVSAIDKKGNESAQSAAVEVQY